MKRLLSIAIVGIMAFATLQSAQAQDYSGMYKTAKVMANTAADTTDVTVSLARHAINFKFQVTKNSGAVAGTIILQTKSTTDASETWFAQDTVTLADATRSYEFKFATNYWLQYRFLINTTGTQNSTIRYPFLWRKLP